MYGCHCNKVWAQCEELCSVASRWWHLDALSDRSCAGNPAEGVKNISAEAKWRQSWWKVKSPPPCPQFWQVAHLAQILGNLRLIKMPNLATKCCKVGLPYLCANQWSHRKMFLQMFQQNEYVVRFVSITQPKIKAQTRVLILVVDIRCHIALYINHIATIHNQRSLVGLRDIGNV